MSSKISGTHRKAFLQALAETGNVTLAADQVRVSKDWAYKLRRRDAAFDAAFREAVERARSALRYAPSPGSGSVATQDERRASAAYPDRPLHQLRWSPSPPLRGREELTIERGNGRVVQLKRSAGKRWTHDTERRFLTALAGCCNVRMAAAELGVSAHAAYKRRRLDPGFARAWSQALEIGYARLQANLIEAACCFFEGEVVPDDNPIRSMSVAEAIQSLNMHKFAVTGAGKGRPGKRG